MTLSIERTLEDTLKLLPDFKQLIEGLPYEHKGIPNSEMFFLYATAKGLNPPQILESGRARGQSTHLLALSFPDTAIVSVEYDASSPDVPIATARLTPFKNVDLQFGDSTRLFPDLIQDGDVVLIDGPKGFRGLRLALGLLATGKPVAVFVHDCPKGTEERRFLDKYLPDVFHSDHPQFVREYAPLDRGEFPMPSEPGQSYGPTLSCLPRVDGFNYHTVLRRLIFVGLANRLRNSFRKLLRAD